MHITPAQAGIIPWPVALIQGTTPLEVACRPAKRLQSPPI